MDQQSYFADFTGARRPPELIGRSALIDRISTHFTNSSDRPITFFLTGDGGIGKTSLLQEIRERAAEHPQEILVPREILDLYNIYTHTPDGLADAIWNILPPAEAGNFSRYEQQKLVYGKQQASGDFRGLEEQHRQTLRAFRDDLRKAVGDRKLLLLLDTAEKALYTTNRTPYVDADIAESWSWLCENLIEIPNLILIVAGRPQCGQLKHQLDSIRAEVEEIEIPSLTEEESLAYWDAMISETREKGNGDLAASLAALSTDTRRVTHYYTNGLPILLSLLIEYLAVADTGAIPEELQISPAEAEISFEHDAQALRSRLEILFIDRLVRSSRTGDTIRALGRVPKGADAELLSRLMDVSIPEARQRLADIRHLSFVKLRPSDERYFLHDVLYEMLNHHIYSHPNDENEALKAEQAVLEHYHEQLARVQRDLTALMQPVWEGRSTQLDFSRYSQITARRQTALAELVFYRLRQNPGKGFLRYYRYMREAILSGQVLLDLLLQTELITFWSEMDPDWEKEEIGGIPRYVVEGVLAIRPVTRAWAEGNYALAIEKVGEIRRDYPHIFQGRGTSSIVDGWEAYARIMRGGRENLTRARQLLTDGIELLSPIVQFNKEHLDDIRLWRVKAVLAFCHRVRGYLNRIQGNLQGAVKDYRISARLGRDTNFRIELGRTLNDMGFAMSELGQGIDGRALVNDALVLTNQLGQYPLATFSLNTLARIEIKQGNFAEARLQATRALSLFRVLEYKRGSGLALIALAEATRRYSQTITPDPELTIRQLREARDIAREAASIFDGDSSEPDRRVEALIEVGCACRDWVRLRRVYPSPLDNIERIKEESRAALEEAASLAKEGILHRHIDALVNLAYLGYYTEDDNLLHDAATRADLAIPSAYRMEKATGRPRILEAEAQRMIWPQLGKLLSLMGFHSFSQALRLESTEDGEEQSNPEMLLYRAVEYLSLGLDYSVLYSLNYQGLSQARQQTYNLFKVLNSAELTTIAQAIEEYEMKYQKQGSSQMRQLLESRALWYGKEMDGV